MEGTVHEESVSADEGHRVSYAEYGATAGTPLVLLHGTLGSHRLGQLFAECARRHDVRLLAVDRPGYGRSSPWPTRRLSDTGEFVTPVLDAAGVSRAGVVGFSGGGPCALALAATHGDRVRDVDVVAGATPPSLGRNAPAVQRLLATVAGTAPVVLEKLFRGQAWVARRTSPALVTAQYTTKEGRDELPDEVAATVRDDFVHAFANSGSGAVTELRLLAREWDVSLERVDRRVRLWHGGRDTNVPVDGVRRLDERLPNSRLTVFEEADHLTTLLRSRSSIVERHADGA